MASDFERFIDRTRAADARQAAMRDADEVRRQQAIAQEASTRKKLEAATTALSEELVRRQVKTTVKIVQSKPRPRTLLELWRGASKFACTEDVIVAEGWKFDDMESSTPDFDSLRVSFHARGRFLSTDGWIHNYSLSNVSTGGALRYTHSDWYNDNTYVNGPLVYVGEEYDKLMSGLARLAVDNNVSTLGHDNC